VADLLEGQSPLWPPRAEMIRHLALPVPGRGVGASEEPLHRTGPHI
jgi:hypothetical protein